MTVKNTPVYGGNGGERFSLYSTNPNDNVKKLEVWSGWGSGDCSDRWVLKGIGVEWVHGPPQKRYNHPDQDNDMYQTFHFPQGASANFGLRSGERVDELEFKTNKGVPWVTGGDGGVPHSKIAQGALVGFEGKAGWNIDSLSLRYRD